MRKVLIILSVLYSSFLSSQIPEEIKMYSISDARQSGGITGYTLDGEQMKHSSRKKLENPLLFSFPSGIYEKHVNIWDDFSESGSLTKMSDEPLSTVFFFGQFNELDPTFKSLTTAEMDAFYNWSLRGGKALLCAGQSLQNPLYSSKTVNKKWGFIWTEEYPSNVIKTNEEGAMEVFDGPFGSVSEVTEGGTLQGFFSKIPEGAIVLGTNKSLKPTFIMDCQTLDLIIADIDVFSSMSHPNFTQGPTVTTPNEVLWANTIVFLDRLQPPPILSMSSNNIMTLNSTYNEYKWFKDGLLLSGVSSGSFQPAETGNYKVEVKVNGGCRLFTEEIKVNIPVKETYDGGDTLIPPPVVIPNIECSVFVPTAFSPDDNNLNDQACVYSKCIKKMNFNIFNQWGELVFVSNDQLKCWDGTYKGKKLDNGVFAWTLSATLIDGSQISQKGNISLIR